MLGEKIRAARLEQKLTQEQLAGRDFTKSYISELERGVRTPRLTTLKILARRLGRPLSYFLAGAAEDGESEAFLAVGLAQLHAGRLDGARASLDRGLEIATQHGDEGLQARLELGLAMVELELGRLPQAAKRTERALPVLSRAEDWWFLARGHACLGRIRLDGGDPASARWAFEAALRIVLQHADDAGLAADLHLFLAEVFRRLGRKAESEQALRCALSAAEPFADRFRVGEHYLRLALQGAAQGRFDAAANDAGRALAIYDSVARQRRLAEIHYRLGNFELADGRWEEAQAHYRWSVAFHGASANCCGVAHTLGCLVEAMLERSSPEGARAVAETALALLSDAGGEHERPHVLRIRGTLYRLLGRPLESRAALEESLRLFEVMGRVHDARVVHQELALLALETQDIAEARRHLMVLQDAFGSLQGPAWM
jgi:transcriptional regulator with XRE-family HTH domain